MTIDWALIDKILGSKSLETGLGVVGSLIRGKADGDARDRGLDLQEANMGLNAAQFRANLLARLGADDRADSLNRASTVLGTSRLGEEEDFVTRNRIARALLPAMANAPRMTPSDPAIAALMPKGGLDLRGVITPEMFAALSDDASASAIDRRNRQTLNVDPSAPITDFGAMGLPTDRMAGLQNYAQQRTTQDAETKSKTMELIMRALEQDIAGERAAQSRQGQQLQIPEGYELDPKTGQLKKKGGFWSKFGKVLGLGANIALPFLTGGLSIPAQIAINAGVGAGTGFLGGGGAPGALVGAGLGAVGAAARGRGGQPRNTHMGPRWDEDPTRIGR